MSGRLVAGIVAAAVVSAPAAASPQTPGAAAGWRDGFVVQSDTGDYRLQLGALLQSDGRFGLDDPQETLADTFVIRRVRPIFQARVARHFDFYLAPDFAGGAVNLRNAYVETRFSPAFRLRFGKDKAPVGLERLQSAASLLFVERGLPTSLLPDRDIGIQVLGEVAGGTVAYAGGVFNGVVDGASADADTNDGKDLAARVIVRPLARSPQHPLAGLGVGIGGTRGTQPAVLPSFRTSAQQTFFTYNRSAVGDGVRHRISPQAFYYYKAFGGFAEYARSTGRVSLGALSGDIVQEAWQIAGSFVVTGERASDRGVRPAQAFDPSSGHWGALQVAARYNVLEVDDRVITLGLVGSGARRAKAFAAGVNWYMNPFVKWVFNFERTAFDGFAGDPRPSEVVLLLRNQIYF
jgi:phosphate-selective porin OprO/OprP